VTTAAATAIFSAREAIDRDFWKWSRAMQDDDLPKKKIVHEIGQDLSLLSVAELTDRIASMREEIARLEAAMAGKQASRQAADMFFKK
jgi:uncharacterized small protein (DUF1192 family)